MPAGGRARGVLWHLLCGASGAQRRNCQQDAWKAESGGFGFLGTVPCGVVWCFSLSTAFPALNLFCAVVLLVDSQGSIVQIK